MTKIGGLTQFGACQSAKGSERHETPAGVGGEAYGNSGMISRTNRSRLITVQRSAALDFT